MKKKITQRSAWNVLEIPWTWRPFCSQVLFFADINSFFVTNIDWQTSFSPGLEDIECLKISRNAFLEPGVFFAVKCCFLQTWILFLWHTLTDKPIGCCSHHMTTQIGLTNWTCWDSKPGHPYATSQPRWLTWNIIARLFPLLQNTGVFPILAILFRALRIRQRLLARHLFLLFFLLAFLELAVVLELFDQLWTRQVLFGLPGVFIPEEKGGQKKLNEKLKEISNICVITFVLSHKTTFKLQIVCLLC